MKTLKAKKLEIIGTIVTIGGMILSFFAGKIEEANRNVAIEEEVAKQLNERLSLKSDDEEEES